MYVVDSASVIIVVMYFVFVFSSGPRGVVSEDERDDETLPEDHYTFVALIDIVFTNGAKKICTGTIIHDNVVITAAHCFELKRNHHIQPEMTTSFVVIGTKKMFDTGYEQYLPIERIIIHPKHKGWTADLALVFTFAGMMSDKPGQVIPLATENTNTPVDSAVMVFSWGKCTEDDVTAVYKPHMESTTVFEDKILKLDDEYRKKEEINKFRQRGKRKKTNKRFRLKNRYYETESAPITRARGAYFRDTTKFDKLMSIEENSRYENRGKQYNNLTKYIIDVEEKNWDTKLAKLNRLYERSEVNRDRMNQRDRRETRGTMSYFRNGWRRKMGKQQNELMFEDFGFVNMQACQKMLHGSGASSLYKIKKREEFLCYNSERRYITEDDAGAPALRKGRLVAVTVGGVDFEGEHVAVGMKMICFCGWIAENLPKKNGPELQCCKNCCDSSTEETETKKSKKHTRKKKKL